jgi:hypothetical protein
MTRGTKRSHTSATAAGSKRRTRQQGGVEELASGALRVRVYAGVDPVTKQPHYLRETIPAGPNAWTLAEQTRTRLLNEVNERRNHSGGRRSCRRRGGGPCPPAGTAESVAVSGVIWLVLLVAHTGSGVRSAP